MGLSYPLWISRGWPYNKSFINQACLVNIAGYIELGEYPVILSQKREVIKWPHALSITHLSSVSCLSVAEVLKLPYSLVLVPPPKSVRLLATNKKELTVHWQRPPELNRSFEIDYKLLLKPQDHQSAPCIQVQYVNNWYWYNEEQLVTKFRDNWTLSNVFGFWFFFR